MTLQELHLLYEKRSNNFSVAQSKSKKQINLISNVRLITALAGIGFAYLSISNPWFGFGIAVCLVFFLFLVKKHALLFHEHALLENLFKINITERKVLDGDYMSLPEGTGFVDPHHPYTHDLDIFGKGSLFQYMNRCNTINGQKQFAYGLANPLTDRQTIEDRQDAIRDVTARIEFRQHIQAAGMESGEQPGDHEQLLAWLKQPSFLPSGNAFRMLLIVIPLLTLCALIGSFFIKEVKVVLFALIITQWSITGLRLKKINIFHDYISQKKNILQKYSRLLYYLQQEKFTATKCKTLQSVAHEADVNIRKLASLVNALDARTNALATLFVNSLLMYDLQCVYRLEKWKADHADKLPIWLNAITETEVLCSYGTFAFNNPGLNYAVITDELKIEAKDLAHPLIDAAERVPNTIVMGPAPAVFIVTGANMAGKSTFLRTLGVNLILALNGTPVCASSFLCPAISLRTGMRTADSLQDHQSYFYAELNRLKTIMDELRQKKPLLILLDEILKGTNSTDKQAGSMALVKQLLPYPCLAIIATHDLALGALEQEYPNEVKNYCFEANIENDQLSFDYKLNAGLAQKMNASFLMKKMGIIPK
ncbi:MAG TPA: hypothetical protein VD884_21950 [Ohtaekwangia sp.]|nr:hypothetical protein [Ohtaekwangia sp.]